MKFMRLFNVRIENKKEKFIKKAIRLFNDENDFSLNLENIDENQIITISIKSDCVLSDVELHFVIFEFGYLFYSTTLIY